MKLGDLVTIVGGGTPSRQIATFWNGSIPWISVKDFNSERIVSAYETITIEGLENSASRLIPKGSIIVPTRMALGKVAINDIDVAINQDLKALLIKENEKLDYEYLFFYIKSRGKYLESSGKGATVKGISVKELADLEVPLPSLQIQRKIASVLSIANSLIHKRKQAIAKLDELVQSVFFEMFGDLAKNDKKWNFLRLDETASITSGVTKGKKYNNVNLIKVPYMRVANVQDGYIDLREIKEIEVSMDDYERYRLMNGDVLLTEGGDPDKLGRGAVWQSEIENCIHQNHIFRVRVNADMLNPYYLAACTSSSYGKRYFLKMAKQTTGIATINMTQLKNFPVPLPPLSMQNEFEKKKKEIEMIKTQMLSQLAKLEQNFQNLLHQAFTGKLQFATERETIAVKR